MCVRTHYCAHGFSLRILFAGTEKRIVARAELGDVIATQGCDACIALPATADAWFALLAQRNAQRVTRSTSSARKRATSRTRVNEGTATAHALAAHALYGSAATVKPVVRVSSVERVERAASAPNASTVRASATARGTAPPVSGKAPPMTATKGGRVNVLALLAGGAK